MELFIRAKYQYLQSCFGGERLEGGMWDGEVGRGEGEGPGAGCLVTFCNCVVLLSCQTSHLTLVQGPT